MIQDFLGINDYIFTTAYSEYKYALDSFNLDQNHELENTNSDEAINFDSYLIIEDAYLSDFKQFIGLLKTNYVLLSLVSMISFYMLIAIFVLLVKPTYLIGKYLRMLMLKNEYEKLFLEQMSDNTSHNSESLSENELKEAAQLYGNFCAYLRLEHKSAVVPNANMFLDWYKINKKLDEILEEKKKYKKLIYSY